MRARRLRAALRTHRRLVRALVALTVLVVTAATVAVAATFGGSVHRWSPTVRVAHSASRTGAPHHHAGQGGQQGDRAGRPSADAGAGSSRSGAARWREGRPDRGLPRRPPLVIAHRGTSAVSPENTVAAYRTAIAQGADSIEGDLVVTRDGVLVVRHEPELSATTDVVDHPEFAGRRTTKQIDGSASTGWFAEDFTLAELKTLRATTRHAVGGRPGPAATGTTRGHPAADETVPTVTEMIDLARTAPATRHRPVILYLELKSPAYFASIGLSSEPRLVEALVANGLAGADAPVFVESFDAGSLRRVHEAIAVPLIQLYWGGTPGEAATAPAALRDVAGYAVGLGVGRDRMRVPARQETAPDGLDRALVDAAHAAGLEVHVYTFDDRSDRPEPAAVYGAYFGIGVDGVFTNRPAAALDVLAGRG